MSFNVDSRLNESGSTQILAGGMSESERSRTLPGPERSSRERARERQPFYTMSWSVSVWAFGLDIHSELLQSFMCIGGSDTRPLADHYG